MESDRDIDTYRPISVGPDPIVWDEAAHDGSPLPSRWCAVPVMVCVLMGVMLVGWAYAGEHPDVLSGAPGFIQRLVPPPPPVPPSARLAAIPKPAPPPPAAAAAPAAPAVAPQPETPGFVSLSGPKGARVFDGDTLLGVAPMQHVATAGPHTLRVQSPGSGKSQSVDVDVRPSETTPIVLMSAAERFRKRRSRPSTASR